MKNTRPSRLAAIFYWIGVTATLASIALVLLGNTKMFATVQHTSFPLAWKFAIVAVLGFLGDEVCHAASAPHTERERDLRHSLEHTPYEI